EQRRAPELLPLPLQSLTVPFDAAPDAVAEAGAPALQRGHQRVVVGDDEPRGRRRRRGANVGGQVAERRGLLLGDPGDDRHPAGPTASSLNGSRSSKLPPPRARMTTSMSGSAQTARSAPTMAAAARGPWTNVSATSRRAGGKRAVTAVTTSRFAAASLPVTRA